MADSIRADRANAQFRKLQRAEEGKKALSDYEIQQAAVRAKTARLRALRLAHEVANPPEPVVSKPARKKPAKKAKTKSAGTLANWLRDQEKTGHRN